MVSAMATAKRPPAEPWERLADEPAKAYEAFRAFRDAGPARTLVGICPPFAHGSVRKWAGWHRWWERARAWDAEGYRLEDARRLEAIRLMDETHSRAARAMIQAGLRAMAELGPLTPHQAARFLDLGTRLERAALLGERLPAPALPAEEAEELSPLERIARELAGTA
jgi:hypothetical protein